MTCQVANNVVKEWNLMPQWILTPSCFVIKKRDLCSRFYWILRLRWKFSSGSKSQACVIPIKMGSAVSPRASMRPVYVYWKRRYVIWGRIEALRMLAKITTPAGLQGAPQFSLLCPHPWPYSILTHKSSSATVGGMWGCWRATVQNWYGYIYRRII